jgi:hypothetical protein
MMVLNSTYKTAKCNYNRKWSIRPWILVNIVLHCVFTWRANFVFVTEQSREMWQTVTMQLTLGTPTQPLVYHHGHGLETRSWYEILAELYFRCVCNIARSVSLSICPTIRPHETTPEQINRYWLHPILVTFTKKCRAISMFIHNVTFNNYLK